MTRPDSPGPPEGGAAERGAEGNGPSGDARREVEGTGVERERVPADGGGDPQQVGPYRILRKIAAGGMGAVYEARQESPQRTVALKVIRPDLSSAELLRRFEHEAEILGRLHHTYIAQIYEAGTAEGPFGTQPYFAMELVEGKPLTAFAEDNALGLRARLGLMQRVAEGVQHAHQKGVIHRDLKPANVLVEEDGTPKILDFGVARVTDADVKATVQTDVGQLLGTLAYMSPEQVAADPLELDTRSDVYALGVMLYELLTGALPYDIDGQLIHEAVRMIRETDPRPMSSINRRLGGEVDVLVGKALEKDKTRRYPSAAALAEDLARYLRDEPIVARRPSFGYQLAKFTRRNQAAVVGVLAVFLAVVAGGILATLEAVRANRAERLATERAAAEEVARAEAEDERAQAQAARVAERAAREEAEQAAERAQAQAARAEATSDFVLGMFESVQPEVARGREVPVRDLLDEAVREIDAGELGVARDVEAAMRATLGRTYSMLGHYESARVQIEGARGIARGLSQDPRELVELELDMARLDRLAGNGEEAEAAIRRALDALAEGDSEARARTLFELARVRHFQSRFEESLHIARDADRMWSRLFSDDEVERADGLLVLGMQLWTSRLYDEALATYEHALDVYRRTGNLDHPGRLRALVQLANVHGMSVQNGDALAALEEALQLSERLYDGDHPRVADVCSALASALRKASEYERALTFEERALAIRRERLGASADTASSLSECAFCLAHLGRLDEAEAAAEEALVMRRAVLGPDSAAVGHSLFQLGRVQNRRGEYAAAELSLRAARENWILALPPDSLDHAAVEEELVRSLRRLGRAAEGVDLQRAALRRFEATFPTGHFRQNELRNGLVQTLLDAGAYAEAEQAIRESFEVIPAHLAPLHQTLRIALGAALAGQGEYMEAEVMMLEAWEPFSANPTIYPEDKAQAAERLRAFYELVGAPHEEQRWRDVRDGFLD